MLSVDEEAVMLTSDVTSVQESTHCHRCGGFMVRTWNEDPLEVTGQTEFVGFRCVQCGNVIDSVILRNRQRRLVDSVELLTRKT
jgi:hypothetical protein